jgi:hypothetical protein
MSKPKFKIGDLVRVSNIGLYPHYKQWAELHGLKKWKRECIIGGTFTGGVWKVVCFGKHHFHREKTLYGLENKYSEQLIVGENGLKHHDS